MNCRNRVAAIVALFGVALAGAASAAEPTEAGGIRLYVSEIVGPSFATLTDEFGGEVIGGSVNDTVLSGGGALGLAFDRPGGALRLEFEGRSRGGMSRTTDISAIDPSLTGLVGVSVGPGWSTMANLWRDVAVNDVFGVYLGGGIGAGGYTYDLVGSISDGGSTDLVSGSSQATSFAWQLGGGATWALSDRVTFDVGYRFYSLGSADTGIVASDGFTADSLGDSVHGFSASELMFTLRIYEPFRRWTR